MKSISKILVLLSVVLAPAWGVFKLRKYELKQNLLTKTSWQSFVSKKVQNIGTQMACASACSGEATCNAYKLDSSTNTCFLASVTSLEEKVTELDEEAFLLNVQDYNEAHCKPPYYKADEEKVCIDNECQYRGFDACSENYEKG